MTFLNVNHASSLVALHHFHKLHIGSGLTFAKEWFYSHNATETLALDI